MAHEITCTCSEAQLENVGCDCQFTRQNDKPVLSIAVREARRIRREEVVAAAKEDANNNIDNSAKYAASSADWYAYKAEWDWTQEGIEMADAAF